MQYFNLQEAAYRLKISEKTLRRWIHQGRIEYQMDHGKFWISEDAITAIQTRKPSESSVTLAARLNTSEQALTQLSDRVAELERGVSEIRAILGESLSDTSPVNLAPSAPPARAPAALRKTSLVKDGKNTLPDGLVPLADFAGKQKGIPHNIAMSTCEKAGKEGRLHIVRGEWKRGGTTIKQCLDAAGRQQFIALFLNNPGFKRCGPDCPECHNV